MQKEQTSRAFLIDVLSSLMTR